MILKNLKVTHNVDNSMWKKISQKQQKMCNRIQGPIFALNGRHQPIIPLSSMAISFTGAFI
jgi:hypothetical protein